MSRLDEHRSRIWLDDEGRRHRVGGPADIGADGAESWWIHGKMHRVGGPAITGADGRMCWCVDGKAHRVGAPAIVHSDGSVEWWLAGAAHRIDGPSAQDALGDPIGWAVNGHKIPADQHAPLNALWAGGQTDRLREVLTVWRPDGVDTAALVAALAVGT